MEPRWQQDWAKREDLRFIGGTPEVDLWLTYSTLTKAKNKVASIRVVLGPKVNDWAWVWWDEYTDKLLPRTLSHKAENPFVLSFINNNIEQLSTYLRLFVPELSTKEN